MTTYFLPDQNTCYTPTATNNGNKVQTEENKAYNDLQKQLDHLYETLPKSKGWGSEYIFLYKNFWLSPALIKGLLLIQTYFKPEPTDIFLASFIKCGTTWLKALMFAVSNRHRYEFSNHPLLKTGPQSAFPYLDTHIYLDDTMTKFDHLPKPRLFATHHSHEILPTSMTSPTSPCKFVYVCRDPKDVLISNWDFMNKLRSKDLGPISLNEAYESFCNGVSEFSPFWDHVLGYWKASKESPDKILFLKFEDLKKEPIVEVRKLAAFMGLPFTPHEEEQRVVEEIVKLCSFETLSSLEVNKGGRQRFTPQYTIENKNFFRKGVVGDWQNYLTEEMKDRIDAITSDKLKGSGLTLGLTK